MISVDHTGNIYPCIRYMPNSLGPGIKPLTIGHAVREFDCKHHNSSNSFSIVHSSGLTISNAQSSGICILKERDCVKCLKRIDRRTQSTDECFSCPIAEGCSWCSAYNYQV